MEWALLKYHANFYVLLSVIKTWHLQRHYHTAVQSVTTSLIRSNRCCKTFVSSTFIVGRNTIPPDFLSPLSERRNYRGWIWTSECQSQSLMCLPLHHSALFAPPKSFNYKLTRLLNTSWRHCYYISFNYKLSTLFLKNLLIIFQIVEAIALGT